MSLLLSPSGRADAPGRRSGSGTRPEPTRGPFADAVAGDPDDFLWQNARTVAGARLLLALGNALVVSLDSSLPDGRHWHDLAGHIVILLLIGYACWAWRRTATQSPPATLATVTSWLDVLFSAALIWSTGGHRSPFFMWNVFAIVGTALKNGWRTTVTVCAASIVLYLAICLPNAGRPDFVPGVFLVRTSYLFIIALVVAHMGQRLLERSRMLAGLHSSAIHMSAGRTTGEIVGRIVDSVTDMLEAERVAVAYGEPPTDGAGAAFGNMGGAQGASLVRLARRRFVSPAGVGVPVATVCNTPSTDARCRDAGDALAGIRNLLVTQLPGRGEWPGVLIACNRIGEPGFTRSDCESAELLAVHAGSLLETARLQEQRRYDAGVDERRRIAAELHDRLIQTLAGMDLRILTCREIWRDERWALLGEELDQLKRLAEEALLEAREAVNELAPVRLREEGLAVFLEDCLQKFGERVAIPVVAEVELADREVPEPTALLILGLLREGLNNIRKHARATQVGLQIQQQGGTIAFRLTDDGTGFSPEACPSLRAPTRHYGLAYLRERLGTMGGHMVITSSPGAGTTLEAQVPVLTEERRLGLLS